jgi:hypothetical protein
MAQRLKISETDYAAGKLKLARMKKSKLNIGVILSAGLWGKIIGRPCNIIVVTAGYPTHSLSATRSRSRERSR